MKSRIKIITAAMIMLLAGAVSASVVGLDTFANEYVGANVSVTLSQASSSGYNLNYDTVASGDSFVITFAGVSGGPVTLAEGGSATFSFTYTAEKVQTMDLGFRWGLNFGDTVLLMRADTASSAGVYASTFFRESYVTASGDPRSASGAVNGYWTYGAGTDPSTDALFKTGSSDVLVVTTVTRALGNAYAIEVSWGGQTYNSSYENFGLTSDGTIDSIFFGHGKDTGGGVAADDNYTISGVSLTVVPEPTTISIFGVGALLVMLLRRSRYARL